ncbi:MAG: hypothetical protein GY935_27575 [Gammaproteobacteria bacterium]|nr:hypothetical protein [Gammaproteobacteria bacterium]
MKPGHPYRYTPFYCEENIWHLAQEPCFREQQTLAVMISGIGPFRRLWFQRNTESAESPVCWDYHVILLSYREGWKVWDLDTALGLPVAASTYVDKTFLHANLEAEQTDVTLRLIAADHYVQSFSSDRSHMKLASGDWSAPPPEWPMILQGEKPNLEDWLNIMQESPGEVLTLSEFITDFLDRKPA